MWFVILLALVFCIGVAITLSNKRRQAKSPRPDPYVTEVRKRATASDTASPSSLKSEQPESPQQAKGVQREYQHCLDLYAQIQSFPDYASFRKEGPPEELSRYAELCRELGGALQEAAKAPLFYQRHARLHTDKPFGESGFVHSSAEEYMQDRIRFFPGRAKYAEEASRQMVLFSQVLETLPEAEILISDAPAPEAPDTEISYSTITKKTPRDKLGNFVVIDTETTGLTVRASIVEIAAIRFRGFQPVEKFTTLCSPKGKISEEASKINGITADMVAGKPQFAYIAAGLQEFIGKDNLVGHNLPFDMKFIMKYGVDPTLVKRKYYDTLDIAKHTLKKWRDGSEAYYDVFDYKLDTLCDYYHIPFFGAHRALADCYATGQLLERLAKDRE